MEPDAPALWRRLADAIWRRRALWLRTDIFVGATVAMVAVAWLALGTRQVSSPRPAVEDRLPLASTVPVTEAPAAVHAAGAVVRPGLYVMPPGARVADVIEAAGGPQPDGDLDRVNLAAVVIDGQQIFVPVMGEPLPAAPPVAGGPAPGPIDLNTATVDALEGLPGVGPATAAAIVAHRDEHGRFRAVDDVIDVAGIGPAKLEAFRDLVVAG